MRKIALTILLAVFLLGLIAPILVLAQPTKPADCCKLKHNIVIKEGKAAGAIACLEGGTSLAADPIGYTKECTKATPCKFKNGCTIGERPADECEGAAVGVAANIWGILCIVNTIYNVTDWIFYFMLIATVILVVIGGAMYMMAAGDPEKAGKGKSLIIYGIIGLAIAVFAKAVPSIVKLILAI